MMYSKLLIASLLALPFFYVVRSKPAGTELSPQPVDFQPAADFLKMQLGPQEFLVMPSLQNRFKPDGTIEFGFDIACKQALSSPSAGKIHGAYRMTGERVFDSRSGKYVSNFRLIVEKFERTNPLPSLSPTFPATAVADLSRINRSTFPE